MTDTTLTTEAKTAESTAPTVNGAFKKMQQIRKELNTYFLEKSEDVDILLMCMLARMHGAFIGDAGEAKTDLIQSLVERLDGMNLFKMLVMKGSTPEELFGLYNPQKLMQGIYEHMTAGMAPEAHVLYLDEGFKGSSGFLNGTLGLLNEREFRNGSHGMQQTPLHFAIVSSNEMPPQGDENLQALWDRFLFRKWVGTLSETGHRQFIADEINRLAQRGQGQAVGGSLGQHIHLNEVVLLQQAMLKVQIPQVVQDGWFRLRNELESAGYGRPSTRRSGWVLRAIMAHALLNGRKVASMDDLAALQYVLWNHQKDIAKITGIVLQIASPLVYEAREWALKIQVIGDTCMAEFRQAGENAMQREAAVIKARKDLDDVRSKLEQFYLQAKGLGSETTQIARWGKECNLMRQKCNALLDAGNKRLTTFEESDEATSIED